MRYFILRQNCQQIQGAKRGRKAAKNSREKLKMKTTARATIIPQRENRLFGDISSHRRPRAVRDRETLWVRVRKKRKNATDSQLDREVEIALPLELTVEQRRRLGSDFVRENFVRKRHGRGRVHSRAKSGRERPDNTLIFY
jgi:hypothetical protein